MKIQIILGLFFLSSILYSEIKIYVQSASQIIGSHQSVNEVRPIALLEAKRLALEQAGTYVESVTVSHDYEITKDEVLSLTAGILFTKILDEKTEVLAQKALQFTITIEATIDLAKLEEEIERLKQGSHKSDALEENKELRERNTALEKELLEHKEKLAQARSEQEADAVRQEGEMGVLKKAQAHEDLEQAKQEIQSGKKDPHHYQVATQILLKIESDYPSLDLISYYQGKIAYAQKDSLEVQKQHFQNTLQQNSKFSLAHLMMARVYLEAYETAPKKKYYLKATKEAEFYLQQNRQKTKGYLLLASIHQKAEREDLAENTLKICIETVPQTSSNQRDLQIATELLDILKAKIKINLPLLGE